ncbi:hypothetical protein RBH26_14235 [Natronolimnohabitans sp. A-GB9]|uniref:hypothetical protein n=1 Tax=Natronolimnohabitans sp. A-GB9 TaxID=3069757 RepID=UPI0027AF2F9A|nr:hypothetical protein [Natronolimnohabitans sp. A-GB9]MDQ2051634.1 hypothetical protein [Natronolimnohabitans sp. A-GB9]
MFPPIASRESIFTDDRNPLTHAYHDVVIYGDAASDEVRYEGPIVVHANGWIELEGNRLLSPHAIHHIDIYDDERGEWEASDDERDDGADGDDYRTNRFSPR